MEKEVILKEGKLLFGLLSDYLNESKTDRSIDEEDLPFVLSLAKQNSLLCVTYLSLKHNGAALPSELAKKLEEYSARNLRKTILFEQERQELYRYLNANKIDFMPLKGIVVNELYKDYGSREFADNDILFDSKHEEKVKEYFLSKDYEVEQYGQGPHDVYQKKPFYNFEMHRFLFKDCLNSKQIQIFERYFKDYLARMPIKKDYEHFPSNEDFFIYFMSHFYKHFSAYGCGVRTLLDIKVILNSYSLDSSYLDKEFSKLGIKEFVDSFLTLVDKLFNEKELSEGEKEIFLHMLSNGTYGTLENGILNLMKEKSRGQYIKERLFPPLSFYKLNYPRAYRSKIGIPFVWLGRLFKAATKSRKNVKTELKALNQAKSKGNQ